MKFPDEVRQILVKKYRNKHREWLAHMDDKSLWPLEIPLPSPTETEAVQNQANVRNWVKVWETWKGPAVVDWGDRNWRILGTQRVPCKLVISGPDDVAVLAGESARWKRAVTRHKEFCDQWPLVKSRLHKYFDVLADYSNEDFQRLSDMVAWLLKNPNSNLYLRQIPVAGLDSKWLEKRTPLVANLVLLASERDILPGADFFQICGLRSYPKLFRLRILDPEIRRQLQGLSDISATWEDIVNLPIKPSRLFVVENHASGLAIKDIPNTVLIMGLGLHVDILWHLPWVNDVDCIYWGDLDTHGLSFLNRARKHIPHIRSFLMDKETLLTHEHLWGEEPKQYSADLDFLTPEEQEVYQGLKLQRFKSGTNIRFEQERIEWNYVEEKLKEL